MVHCSVYCVNLLLQDDGFLVDVVNQHCQLTEEIGLGDSPGNIDHAHEYELLVVSCTHVTTEQEQAGSVERDNVLIGLRFVKESALVLPAPDVIQRSDTLLLDVTDVVPDASDEVDVHQQEEDQFDQFDRLYK